MCVCVCVRVRVCVCAVDVLDRGTWYRLTCTVTDTAGQQSRASVSFYIYNGVTSCQISVSGGTYTELDAVSILLFILRTFCN